MSTDISPLAPRSYTELPPIAGVRIETAAAGIKLLERLGGEIVGCAFIVDLPELGGRRVLEELGMDVHVLCEFEGA